MSGTLLVTQFGHSIREFRRPIVRRAYRFYLERYRRAVVAAATRLAGDGPVTVLTAREILDPSMLPSVSVRYTDEQAYRVYSDEYAGLARALARDWWPRPEDEPELVLGGVWLPDVLAAHLEIVLRLEVVEPLGIVTTAMREVKPTRVVVLSGRSTPERLAQLVAQRDGIAVEVASPRAYWTSGHAYVMHAALLRDEWRRRRDALRFPRRPPDPDRSSGAAPAAAPVIVVGCRPRHRYVLEPLSSALGAAGAPPHLVALPHSNPTHTRDMADWMAATTRSGASAQYATDDLSRPEAAAIARRYRGVARRVWHRVRGRLSTVLTQGGLPLESIARPFLRRALSLSLPAAAAYQQAAFRTLDAVRPRAVVITFNRRFPERALSLAGRVRGIPSLLFSGALVAGRGDADLVDVSDRVLVIGDHLRARLVDDAGVDPDRITVVGDPRSNAARLIPRAQLAKEVSAHFGLPAGRPIVLMLSKYVSSLFSPAEKETYYRTVFGAAAQLGDVSVIVKVHPNEELGLLRDQIVEWGCPEARLTQDHDIHRLFGAADVTVMVTSMGGLEAMAMGCPVVAVQTPGKDFEGEHMPPYVSEGVVERVDAGDAAGLARAITRLIEDPAERGALVSRGEKFAARYVHPVDGQLGPRVLSVIDDVARALRGGARA